MGGSAQQAARSDFFISYTQSDRPWAEWIAWCLEHDGYRVLIQAWDMVPGAHWVRSMHEGVQQAERTLALLSPDYLSSIYGAAEWQAAWRSDPTGAHRKLIALRVRACDHPDCWAWWRPRTCSVWMRRLPRRRLRQVIDAALTSTPRGYPSPTTSTSREANSLGLTIRFEPITAA